MKKRSTLERQMLSYFGLIAAASLLITVEFIWAIQAVMSQATALTQPADAFAEKAPTVLKSLGLLRNQALMMCAVQAVVTLIVLLMLIRRITGPLQQMVEHSRMISEGDLSKTIEIRRQDEIGLMGETINGLTSNIQEIVALSMSMEASLSAGVESLRRCGNQDDACKRQVEEMADSLAGFRDILHDFKLFPAPLSEKDPEGKSSSCSP
jgi:methyl-accepting chemotaxis protein